MPDWKGAYRIDGQPICADLHELKAQVTALETSRYADLIQAYVTEREIQIHTQIDAAARTICAYANAYENPILVLEALSHEPDLSRWLSDPDAHLGTAYLLSTAQERLKQVAKEQEIDTTTVSRDFSSTECHHCGVLGDRPATKTFRCQNPTCPVETVYSDYNAAKVLAQRYHPGQTCAYQPQPVATDGGVSK